MKMPAIFFQTLAGFKPLRFAIVFWACAPTYSAHAAGPAPDHPLVGTWSWSLSAGKCLETYQYRPDGVLLGTSGEAVIEWTYTVSPQASAPGFYEVFTSSVRQNGKKDCSGDVVDKAGTTATAFVQLSPNKDRYISCREESLTACFGPLRRVK